MNQAGRAPLVQALAELHQAAARQGLDRQLVAVAFRDLREQALRAEATSASVVLGDTLVIVDLRQR